MQGFELSYNEALKIFLDRPDIRSAMIGYKYVGGRRTETIAIRFGIEKKLPLGALSDAEILPSEIKGKPTDVYEVNPRLLVDISVPTYSIMAGGLCVGAEGGENHGTLGLILRDSLTGNLAGLTNYHVLADSIQEELPRVPLTYVSHPSGEAFGSNQPIRIGKSLRYLIDEDGDAAAFTLSVPGAPLQTMSNAVIVGEKIPELGETVGKAGAESGEIKYGTVNAYGYLNTDFSEYGHGWINVYCMEIVPVSDPGETIAIQGDSGSLVYTTSDNYGVGLLFASNAEPGTITYACLLSTVLSDLDLEILPVEIQEVSQTVSCLHATETTQEAVASCESLGKADYLSVRMFAIENSETTYDTLEDYALAMEYPSLEDMLERFDCDTELEYAQLEGYNTVEDFLDAVKVPHIQDALTAAGIIIA